MRKILVIGIGTGNPEHMTVQAINALNRADVIFIPTKGAQKSDLAEIRREIVSRYSTRPGQRSIEFSLPKRNAADPSYVRGVDDWHAAISAIYSRLFAEELQADGTGAFLVWGDPMLYDSTIRILERVKSAGDIAFEVEVFPGITSIQALCATHRIPLNLVGKPVEITTGRRLVETFPARSESAIVMLDGEQAFAKIDDPEAEIFWGAYLGTPDEMSISGRLKDVAHEIVRQRAEAREKHGWIMDIYLMRKGADFDDE
jgi:precorrin-6A synthase